MGEGCLWELIQRQKKDFRHPMITMVMLECIRNGLEADEVFGVRRLPRDQAEALWDTLIKEEDQALRFTTPHGYKLLLSDDRALWNYRSLRRHDIFSELSKGEKFVILETLRRSLTLRKNGGCEDEEEVAKALEWMQVVRDELAEEYCVWRDGDFHA